MVATEGCARLAGEPLRVELHDALIVQYPAWLRRDPDVEDAVDWEIDAVLGVLRRHGKV